MLHDGEMRLSEFALSFIMSRGMSAEVDMVSCLRRSQPAPTEGETACSIHFCGMMLHWSR